MEAPQRDLVFVFDMAGVLVEWDADALYGQVFAGRGRDRDHFFNHVFGDAAQSAISAGEPMKDLLGGLLEKHPDWCSEIKLYWDRWDEMVVGAIDGTVAVVSELKERGHRVYVLGNWGREEFDRALPRFDFLDWFDDILLSGDCGILKPDPGIFEIAENRFGLVPEQTVFIDDRSDNVAAAISRNWNGIVFENPRQLYLTLMDYGIL
jgi:2-haloacid dehalogenase